jgi:hypothetical protein
MLLNHNELEAAYTALKHYIRELRLEQSDFHEEDSEWQEINFELKFITYLYSKIDNYLDSELSNV